MTEIFRAVLNMSLTASVVIAAVCVARLFLRRAPKAFSYALWAVALFNLLCPFKIDAPASLNPVRSEPVTADIANPAVELPSLDAATGALRAAVTDAHPSVNATPHVSDGPIWTFAGDGEMLFRFMSNLWLVGVAALLLYAVAGCVLLRRKLRFATRKDGNVYETDRIRSPFVLGFLRPRIYLPVGLAESDLAYVLRHERTHIKRRDYLVKPLAFLALSLHWFNPLVWLAYVLINRDMEMSCDERVLKEIGGEDRISYANALLALAAGKRPLGLSPLAFGEGGTKGRIKNVLNFKKPTRRVVLAAAALVAVLTAGFAVNGADKTPHVRIGDSGEYGAAVATGDAESRGIVSVADKGDKMTLHSDIVAEMQITRVLSGQSTGYGVANKQAIERLGDWLGALSVKEERFADGKTPGDAGGGEVYSFSADAGNGLTHLFSYIKNGPAGCYIAYNDAWYSVKNPSDPPMPASEMHVKSGLSPITHSISTSQSETISPIITHGTSTSQSKTSVSPIITHGTSTSFSSTWAPLADLPLDYDKGAAIADGVYVNVHGSEIYNQKMVDLFYESVFAEKSAMMRTMEYTVEGDAIITDYRFDGDTFTVTVDARRDSFGAQEIGVREYLYLVPFDRSRPAGTETRRIYFLSNERNIYTDTGDGGVMLIDDLAPIPSPTGGQ
jgi:beta-lactamase regulating signal transducer with metallopeptidase domain